MLQTRHVQSNTTSRYHSPANYSVDIFENTIHGPISMYVEQERLKSFGRWCNHNVKPESLAKAGFYFTFVGDRVRCPFCGLEVESWEQGDDAISDHRRWSESCPFLVDRNSGNVPIDGAQMMPNANSDGLDTCGRYGIEIRPNSFPERESITKYAVPRVKAPVYSDYNTYEQRLASYKEWPISLKQRPKELSEAGFYYTGKGDKTLCFHCGGGLKNWEESDDPWEQHAKWFSCCEYLALQKGAKYIADVCKGQTQPIISARDASNIISTTNGSSDDEVTITNNNSDSSEEVATVASTSASDVKTESSDSKVPVLSSDSPGGSQDGSSSTLCKICYNKEIGVAFLPCGHVVACVDCAPALTKCAVCCGEIAASCRVFLS